MSADGAEKPPEEITPVDWHRLYRSQLEHEDGQICQRIGWLVNSQAFMFTAYAVTTNGLRNPSPGIGTFPGQAILLFRLLPLVAIFTALLIYTSILAAFMAIRELRRAYQAKATVPEGLLFQASISTRLLGLAAPTLLPPLFVVVWSALLIHSFHRVEVLQRKPSSFLVQRCCLAAGHENDKGRLNVFKESSLFNVMVKESFFNLNYWRLECVSS